MDVPPRNAALIEKLRLPFPVLSDPARDRAVTPFGVADERDPRELARPAVVVLDRDGEERFRHVARDFADRVTVDELLEVLRRFGDRPVEPEPVEVGPAEPGPKAMALAELPVYYRGARFAAVALGSRVEQARDETARYVSIIDGYREVVRSLLDG